MQTKWKHYYTRHSHMQDIEATYVHAMLLNGHITESLGIPESGKWEGWFKEDELNNYFRSLQRKISIPSWNISEHVRAFNRDRSALLKAAQNLARAPYRGATNREIIRAYNNYIDSYPPYLIYLWMPWAITEIIDDWFVERLAKKFQNWKELYELLARPPHLAEMEKLERALMCWKIRRGSQKKLERLTKRYGHLGSYSVSTPPWNSRNLTKLIADIANPRRHLLELQKSRRIALKGISKALMQLKKEPILYRVGKTINLYTWIRNERADAYKYAIVMTQPFYRWFERHFCLPKYWAADLTRQEMIDSLEKNGLACSMRELQMRVHHGCMAYITLKKTAVVSHPKKQLAFIKGFMPNHGVGQRGSIKGKPTCPGLVRGKVFRILHLSDVKKMPKGAVLLANMTHPDYMPAIRKASAIVTDEGGVVCHAAIISRELKIPCVTGTGEATKVFKNGDRVEVDAEKGIVKIIA